MAKRKINGRAVAKDIKTGMSAGELATEYGLTPGQAARLLDKLVTAGLIDERDRKRLAARTGTSKPSTLDPSRPPARREPTTAHVPGVVRDCPACGADLGADSDDCPRCGVVASKYLEKHGLSDEAAVEPNRVAESPSGEPRTKSPYAESTLSQVLDAGYVTEEDVSERPWYSRGLPKVAIALIVAIGMPYGLYSCIMGVLDRPSEMPEGIVIMECNRIVMEQLLFAVEECRALGCPDPTAGDQADAMEESDPMCAPCVEAFTAMRKCREKAKIGQKARRKRAERIAAAKQESVIKGILVFLVAGIVFYIAKSMLRRRTKDDDEGSDEFDEKPPYRDDP